MKDEDGVKILVRMVNVDDWLFSADIEPQVGEIFEAMQHRHDPELYWLYFIDKKGVYDRRGIYKWRVEVISVPETHVVTTGWDTP